ncbi:hypothetical protein [Actinorugispora endophytica]|uniref:Uncharacterized protein n=1 Tax=Actinorugispora endophytica TaxID=1605990 RepID=A0A4R6UQD7_9ACTN|nr:hypothetical protein [Actinorugispora endophytica]TDQ49241.1 hypothetical protein EV190_11637 [Actinorugispora endophytica]
MYRKPPKDLRIARVLLFVVAGISLAVFCVGAAFLPLTPSVLAELTWILVPGVLSLVFGVRIPKGGRPLFWSIVVLQALFVLFSLGELGQGPRGLTQMLFPVLILVFVLRRPSRDFLGGRAEA